MNILDTLPPMGDLEEVIYAKTRDFIGHGNLAAVEAVIRERDRIVAEHVVRMCAEVCNAVWMEDYIDNRAASTCEDRILALLEKT